MKPEEIEILKPISREMHTAYDDLEKGGDLSQADQLRKAAKNSYYTRKLTQNTK